MKKILLIGGSFRDIPLIKSAKKLGLKVVSIGKGRQYLGHRFADKFYEEDYKNTDLIKQIIKKENIQAIIPGCSELAFIISTKLSNELGLNKIESPENLEILFNKHMYKTIFNKLNIPTPKWEKIEKTGQKINLDFPFIIKPVDTSGGVGIYVINNKNELDMYLENSLKATKESFVIVEEYIEGELFAYSAVIKDKKIIFDFLARDIPSKYKTNIATSYPVFDKKLKEKLNNYISKFTKYLNLSDGAFHCQFILKNGMPYIIDITRRIPGDLFPYLIEYSTEYPYSENIVKLYLGLESINTTVQKKNFIIRHCVFSEKKGKLKDLNINDSIKENLIYKFDVIKKGEEIENEARDRISILFFYFDKPTNIDLSNFVKVETI